MAAVAEIGCIVCLLVYHGYRQAMIHHTDGKTKPGCHFLVIGLCFDHHQGGKSEGMFISRHPYKAAFEEAYGTEEFLLGETRRLLNERSV